MNERAQTFSDAASGAPILRAASPLVHPSLYTDGGLLGSNPSSRAITWAWCRVEQGVRVDEEAGWIRATELPVRAETGFHEGTSNQAEFFAALRALESLADGEIVSVYCDSQVTIDRYNGRGGLNGIPPLWRVRMNQALRRHGGSSWHHVDGHPSATRKGPDGMTDLQRGHKLNGDPVSEHNVYCDMLCTQQVVIAELVLESERARGISFGGGIVPPGGQRFGR